MRKTPFLDAVLVGVAGLCGALLAVALATYPEVFFLPTAVGVADFWSALPLGRFSPYVLIFACLIVPAMLAPTSGRSAAAMLTVLVAGGSTGLAFLPAVPPNPTTDYLVNLVWTVCFLGMPPFVVALLLSCVKPLALDILTEALD